MRYWYNHALKWYSIVSYRDFLPRGSDIVTRRPLILQLVTAAEGKCFLCRKRKRTTHKPLGSRIHIDVILLFRSESGRFLHCPEKQFTIGQIREEIEKETNRLAGGKMVSSEPIRLTICSPTVPNLTLIDLPGMTKVPIGGQPHDIEKQIRNMIYTYINNDNCLILAVSPANADLSKSDALNMARQVDPEGKRTFGVITKLDLMDAGTDALAILENKVYPLVRGIVGIVNRSQRDINEAKDIRAALNAETDFFKNHPVYGHLACRSGTKHLCNILSEHLIEHIRENIPKLKDILYKKVVALDKEIKTYRQIHPDEEADKRQLLFE